MKDKETNSGDSAETSIGISVGDMKYVELTKWRMSKKARLHEIIVRYRQIVMGEKGVEI